jgi:hypothetical protein
MLTKNIKKALILASVAVGLFSCRSMVEGYENSPNSPTSAPAPILLTSAQVSSAYLAGGEPTRLAGMWSGYFTGSDRQYLSYYTYDVNAGIFDNMWSNIYVETVTQARLATQGADKAKNPIVGGIARIMEANAIGNATALFGDIPFSESIDGSKTQPKFDTQADVYAGVQKLLDQAIVNLSSGTGSVPNDIFYLGNSTKWLKVAYTLKARFFMHTRNYQEAYTNALKGITASADDMTVKYGGNQEKDQNIYYDFGQNNRQGYLTSEGAMAVRILTTGNAMYRGNAKTDETSRKLFYYTSDGSDLNYDGMFSSTSPTPVVTYAENILILAESAARTNNTTVALGHLNTYRTWLATKFASRYDAYTLADFAPGGIDNKGTLTAEKALLKEILEERYISFIAQLEGFNDLRRTFKETDVRVTAPINKGTQFPQRFLYAQAELNANAKAPKQTPVELFDATPINK